MSEQVGTGDAKAGSTANIVYILYLAGVIVGITPLIGVIMAYVYRSEAPSWVQTHYTFQIRTFWIGLLFSVIGLATTFILIGWLILLLVLIWWILRCVKGMQVLGRGEPYPNPESWMV